MKAAIAFLRRPYYDRQQPPTCLQKLQHVGVGGVLECP
jgi:hypothetical protein